MKNWKDEEVKALFKEVEDCKNGNNSLRFAFENHAKKYGRKTNSVRNYYYQEVDNLQKDEKRCKLLCFDASLHNKIHFETFQVCEENNLISEIEKYVKNGESVRSACLKISNGDLKEMTRLQNKYQNIKRKELKSSGNCKIIPFKQRQKILTENDINSLFMGLVKLIRKSAVDEFMEKSKIEKDSSNYLLKKAFIDLSQKDKQISQLRDEFKQLKDENMKLVEIVDSFRSKREQLKNRLQKKYTDSVVEN